MASLELPGVEIAAVADRDGERASVLAAQFGAVACASVEELVARGLVDAVYIALPHRLHGGAVVEAASAGLHVLVDKPMCSSEAEAASILSARDRAGVVVMVGFSHRFTTELRDAKDVVESGELGDLAFLSDLVVEGLASSPDWYWDEEGGGVLQLQAHHSFDRAAWLVGSPITEIGANVRSGDERARGGAASLAVRFASGLIGSLGFGLQCAYGATPIVQLVLQGTRGLLRVDTWEALTVESATRSVRRRSDGGPWLQCELEEFIAAIRDRRAPSATAEDGLAALRCALAARRSAATGSPVAVAVGAPVGGAGVAYQSDQSTGA